MDRTLRIAADWEQTVTRLARDSANRDMQPVLDLLVSECAGRPLDVVRDLLVEAWAAATQGGRLVNPRLDCYTADLAQGRQIVLD